MKWTSYSLKWLTDKFDGGEQLKYLFFWGHTNRSKEEVGNFCFSQWFELPFTVDGIIYKTAEHWMMANKALLFEDVKTYNKIIAAKSPGEAKELGRLVMGFDDQVWVANRFNIVVNGNIHKFNQHPQFATFLLNTKDRILVEASPVDKIWGIGLAKDAENIDNPHFWNGENLLGFALMEVRDFIRDFGHFEKASKPVELPWKSYPDIHPYDIFWRMGIGETLIDKFNSYYDPLPDRDKTIFQLTYPAPFNWEEFYL